MSAVFNGTSSVLAGGATVGIERTQTLAISVWVKFSGTSPAVLIALVGNLGSTSARGWRLTRDGAAANDPFFFQLRNAAGNQLGVTFPCPNDTNWHHVALSYNGSSNVSGVVAWVDGVSQTITTVANTLSQTIVDATPAFNLGARIGMADWLAGNMADVGVWIDLNVTDFAAVVANLASGIRPLHIPSIRAALSCYQPLVSAVNEAGIGPTLTEANMSYDSAEHSVMRYPSWWVRRRAA